MLRKLIQQGPSSLTVYLPKKWVENNHLVKGNEVDVQEIDGKVVITQNTQSQKSNVDLVMADGVESYIRTLLTAAYRSGYDRISIECSKESQKKTIEKIVREKLIGFDITRTESSKVILESISEPDDSQFDNIFQKLFMNIEQLFECTLERISSNKKPEEDYEEIENRIMRYDSFCRRLLLKKRFDKKAVLIWAFLVQINHSQREIYFLNRLLEKKTKINPKVINLINECKKYLRDTKETYFQKDKALLVKLNAREKELIYDKGYALLHNTKSKESIIIHHVLSSIRSCYQSTSPLAGLLLEI